MHTCKTCGSTIKPKKLSWHHVGFTSYPPYPGQYCADVYECEIDGLVAYEGPRRIRYFLNDVEVKLKDILTP